jgi:hypothetical protein
MRQSTYSIYTLKINEQVKLKYAMFYSSAQMVNDEKYGRKFQLKSN